MGAQNPFFSVSDLASHTSEQNAAVSEEPIKSIIETYGLATFRVNNHPDHN